MRATGVERRSAKKSNVSWLGLGVGSGVPRGGGGGEFGRLVMNIPQMRQGVNGVGFLTLPGKQPYMIM